MDGMTRENLLKAMRNEAFAYARYMLFARRALLDGNAQVADLFERAAEHEFLEPFAELTELLELGGTEAQNLRDAIEGSTYVGRRGYRAFARQAELAGETRVAERLNELVARARRRLSAFRIALAHASAEPGDRQQLTEPA
jgi:rubrerythrin